MLLESLQWLAYSLYRLLSDFLASFSLFHEFEFKQLLQKFIQIDTTYLEMLHRVTTFYFEECRTSKTKVQHSFGFYYLGVKS